MSSRIRLATEADAAACQAIYAPVVRATTISFEAAPPSVAEMAARVRQTLPTFPWLVCVRDDTVIGYAYAGTYRARAAYQWSAEVSVYIGAEARRQGVARRLYTALFDLLRLQGYCNAYAGTTIPNPPSVALHEALGFQLIGTYARVGFKHGAWHDVKWFHLDLQPERPHLPRPPLPPAALRETAAWQAVLEAA